MSQPVWVLSVDLQTKTATFQSGLADAARSARGAFSDIKGGAGEMGRETGYSMMEARHSVMLLGEEFGVHLPRAVAGFVASIGPLGGILEAAFPFLAIIAGATILIEHLQKIHEAGEKLTQDQLAFGTAAANAFNQMDRKILEAQIRADELNNNHLAALRHQLQLIDMQSLDELVKSFEEVAKAAEPVMKGLESHWYTFGKGSAGAEHSLTDFIGTYKNLQSLGDDKGASALLDSKIAREQTILDALKDKQAFDSSGSPDDATYQRGIAAAKVLAEYNVKTGVSLKDQIASHEQLVSVLMSGLALEERKAVLEDQDKKNAVKADANGQAALAASAAKEHAGSLQKLGQDALNAQKATADAALDISRASLEERLAENLSFAAKQRDLDLQTNAAEIAALDKYSKDYTNELKALNDKSLEIKAAYAAKVTEETARTSVEVAQRDLQALQQGEREKIEATQQGTAQRLQAIDAAIKEEQSKNLTLTEFYRNLLTQRVQAQRQEALEEAKLREEAGKQSADTELKSNEMILAARRQAVALSESLTHQSAARQIADATQNADMEYTVKLIALQQQIAALDTSGKEYLNKLKALQDQEREMSQTHEQQITDIKVQAELRRNQEIESAEHQAMNSIASGLTQSIMGHETWAKMVTQFGNQAVEGMIKNSILILAQQDQQRLGDAKTAASNAYASISAIPIIGPVLAPAAAAVAFGAVMAFDQGTDFVPGDPRRGDVVPAMLKPGEGVVPGGVMDGLRNMAKNGGFDQSNGPHTHLHQHITYHVNTIDGDGMHDALEKHSDQLVHHFNKAVRKMNR